ncbi:methyltransferase domain-containing protein [Nostoc sp. UHCC 0702]|nr:methyltransferase domain-containing protein [Nostoc sp. UHCC 0702]
MHPLIRRFLMWNFQERTNRVVNILKPHLQGATLDVGCGNGDVTKHLNHDNIIGIDVYEPINPRIEIKLFDGVHIPFETQSFDTVLCTTSLHHVDEPAALIAEMRRVGKKLVILEDNFDNFIRQQSVLLLHAIAYKILKIPYEAEKFKSRQVWEQFFTENGLRIVGCTKHSTIVPLWPFLGHYLFILEPAEILQSSPSQSEKSLEAIHR